MSPKWTDEQKNAIHAKGCNLLVSAGAGSGKTAVLVTRILRILTEEKVPLDSLLVVTFTKAAAGEMKERLRRGLMAAVPEDKEQQALIADQLQRLNYSWITTFHGFCRQLLQRHFNEVNLEPRFRVLDSTEADHLRKKALASVLEEAYESADPDFLHWVECYSGNRTDHRLETMILGLHEFLLSQSAPWEWADRILGMYGLPMDDGHPWIKLDLLRKKAMLDEIKELLERAYEVAGEDDGPVEYLKAIASDMDQTEMLQNALAGGRAQWRRALGALDRTRLAALSKSRKLEVSQRRVEMVKDLREEVWDILKALRGKGTTENDEKTFSELAATGNGARVLVTLVLRFDSAYAVLKEKAGGVDYSDLEHKTLALLKSEAIRGRYQEFFRYIFVDEYQDSNGVQEAIIQALERKANRFMVGDVKQSIYRFRLAEPELFVEKLGNSSSEEGSLNRRIDLNRNFRSRKEIIDAINWVFGATMSPELGDVAYDAGARLIAGADYPGGEDEPVTMTVLYQEDSDDNEDDNFGGISAEREARAVGSHILKIVGTPIWDPRASEWRPARWEDTAVLLRAIKPWHSTVSKVFSEMGIPLNADAGSGSGDAWELRLLVNLLKLVGNAMQDLPLLVVLRSPLGGFSVEELAQFRAEIPEGSFRDAVQAARLGDTTLGRRLDGFYMRLATWQEQCRNGTLGQFLWTIAEHEGLLLYCTAMKGGDTRRERILWAVGQADQRAGRGTDTPEALADHLEQLMNRGEMPTASQAETAGGVQLMSIHKSKGLEFPVVFLMGMGRQFNRADMRDEVLKHRKLGFALRYIDPALRIRRGTLITELIQDSIGRENLSEELRILYVAMTRAMDRLHIYGSVTKLDKPYALWQKGPELFFLKNAKSYLEWLMPPLLSDYPEEERWEGARTLSNGVGRIAVEFRQAFDGEKTQAPRAVRSNDVGRADDEEGLLKEWPWEYPWEDMQNTPTKISVTELGRLKESQESKAPGSPLIHSGTSRESGLSGAELGTVHHTVFQHLDYKGALDAQGIGMQLKQLVRRKILTGSDADHVRVEWITAYLNSDLGRRMMTSSRVLREVPFVVERDYREIGGDSPGQVLLQGVIDCCFREDGEWVIVDYKTDAGSDAGRMSGKYQVQLNRYSEALEELTGERVKETWLYMTRSGEAIEVKKYES